MFFLGRQLVLSSQTYVALKTEAKNELIQNDKTIVEIFYIFYRYRL